jgi:hypothetical protein
VLVNVDANGVVEVDVAFAAAAGPVAAFKRSGLMGRPSGPNNAGAFANEIDPLRFASARSFKLYRPLFRGTAGGAPPATVVAVAAIDCCCFCSNVELNEAIDRLMSAWAC